MRFKVDESLHVEVADLLRGQGHDALTVFDQGLRGRGDHDIADMCRSENRVLLSLSGGVWVGPSLLFDRINHF